MSTKLGYFARETLISLRRNLLMTLAGVLTVTVSLFLFGGILLLSKLVDHGTERWKGGVEFEIFMTTDPEATQQQIDAVGVSLEEDPQVEDFTYYDKEAAYEEFKRLFRNDPALVESIDPDALPVSYRVTPVEAEDTEALAGEYASFSGVDDVLTAQEETERLLTITSWVRWAFWLLAGVLLLSALFLIVNTIRLATFARRREIEVMKLVGASNWFVRVPFLAEGLTQGVLGAGVAIAGIGALYLFIDDRTQDRSELFQGFYLTSGDFQTVALWVLLIGALIGGLGSLIGLRRFLRV